MNHAATRGPLTALTVTLVLCVLGAWPGPAHAAGVSRSQAVRLAKQTASRYLKRYGISYPTGMWWADCTRRPREWICGVETDTRQCFGSMHVSRSARHPRVRKVRIFCGE